MTAADKYYLKAKENYPYNLDDALEALEYGLSCDDMHPGLLTLMGDIYYKDLEQFDAARECYELAMISDKTFIQAYTSFIEFCLKMEEFDRADKLITTALKLKGVDRAQLLYYRAHMFEGLGKYRDAIDNIRQAKENSLNKKHYTFLEEEAERIALKERHIREYNTPVNIVLTG